MKVTWRNVVMVLIAAGMLAFLSLDASAQCSLCRASLSGAGNDKFIQGLNTGVLVLLLPPVSIFCSIFYILRKHNKESDHEQ